MCVNYVESDTLLCLVVNITYKVMYRHFVFSSQSVIIYNIGRCEKDKATYICKVCKYSCPEQANIEVHIRRSHLGEAEAVAPVRGPNSAPTSWVIQDKLLQRTSTMATIPTNLSRHMFPLPVPSSSTTTDYPKELPYNADTNNLIFSGNFSVKSGKNSKTYKNEFGTGSTLVENRSFVLNCGAKITDISWLNIGPNCDAFVVVTTPDFYAPKRTTPNAKSGSSVQFWRFDNALTANQAVY